MTSPRTGRAALAFIFVTVVLDMLALGAVLPVLPRLVLQFLGGDSASAARVYGLFGAVWALMQFFFSPLLGALSDRHGRRPVILLSNFGLGLDYVLMALAPTLGWLFAGRVVSGITSASIGAASAYIADVTPPERRAAAFGLIGVAFGVGFVLGPALGGLLGAIDPRLPFWVAAGLSLANALYGFLVLPESLPPERRASPGWRRASPVGSLGLLRSTAALGGLAAALFLYRLAHDVLPSTFVLYADYRYGWDERAVGLTLAAVGIGAAVVAGGLVGPVVRRVGERRALALGLLAGVAGFLVYGLAPTGGLFLVGLPLISLWGLAGPAFQGLLTRQVGPAEQGRLQGALASLGGVAALLSPPLFTQTFAFFVGPGRPVHLPGAPFLLAAALTALAAGLAWRATRN
jgi:DHA1 family tetracycline resistance protein-like MFS transporter